MADCSGPNVILNPIGCGVQAVVGDQMTQFAQTVIKGVNDLSRGFFTSWIEAPMDGVIGGDVGEWFKMIATPIQVVLLSLGLMVAGVRMALLARGEPGAEAAKKFLRAVLVTIAGTAFIQVFLLGCNALAKWILQTTLTTDGVLVAQDLGEFGSNTALALIFGIFALILVGIQWIIMVVRAVALTVLVPWWPIAASGAMFDKHEDMFGKVTGWLLAFGLYSPVAAALYGMSVKLRQGGDGLAGVMIGMGIFVLALVALPALMRLVMPLSAAVGRANPGSMMLSGMKTAAVAGVAVGATVATAGAAAPAVAGAGAGAGTGGGAVATGASVTGASGASGVQGAQGVAGAAGANSSGSSAAGGGATGASGGGSSRSGWDAARDLAHAAPGGAATGAGEMFDE